MKRNNATKLLLAAIATAFALLLLWVNLGGHVKNFFADNRLRWCAEAQSAVESWLRKDTNEWFKAEFGDFVSLTGSGYSTPVWNIQGFDYLTLNRTAQFTRGTIPIKIYVTGGEPGQTKVGTPVLEGQVSPIQGARIFVSHPEFHLGLVKPKSTQAEIETGKIQKQAEEQRVVAGVNQKQFEQAAQRWFYEGLAAVGDWLRSGTNDISLMCGDFIGFEQNGSEQTRIGEFGTTSNRYHCQIVYVKAHFSLGYIPLTIYVTEGRLTAPGLANIGTPVINGTFSSHTGARIFVSHPELCTLADFSARDSLEFLKVEGEAKLVGEYKPAASFQERSSEPTNQICTLQLRADHTLVISNCPAPGDAQRLVTIPGNWSLHAYRNAGSGDTVFFRMPVNGGDEVKLQGANCYLTYPNDFNRYRAFMPTLDVIIRDEAGNQQKLFFRAVKGSLPDYQRPDPHFVRRLPTGNPPNWDTLLSDSSESRLREAIIYQRARNIPNNTTIAIYQVRLADILRERGKQDEAETNLLEGIQIYRKSPANHQMEIGDALAAKAHLLQEKGDLEGAEKAIREALAIRSQIFKPENVRVKAASNFLNQVLKQEGKPEE